MNYVRLLILSTAILILGAASYAYAAVDVSKIPLVGNLFTRFSSNSQTAQVGGGTAQPLAGLASIYGVCEQKYGLGYILAGFDRSGILCRKPDVRNLRLDIYARSSSGHESCGFDFYIAGRRVNGSEEGFVKQARILLCLNEGSIYDAGDKEFFTDGVYGHPYTGSAHFAVRKTLLDIETLLKKYGWMGSNQMCDFKDLDGDGKLYHVIAAQKVNQSLTGDVINYNNTDTSAASRGTMFIDCTLPLIPNRGY